MTSTRARTDDDSTRVPLPEDLPSVLEDGLRNALTALTAT